MTNKDYTLPYQDLINLVPRNLRDPMITSLIDNLFNRFLTHDEAVPLYGYVGRKPASPDDRTPKIPQQSIERDINALVPVLSFKVGTETYSFTVQDIIRKAEVLGISKDQNTWLYSQGNNYAPPIDFDRFTNFFNYYWVADALANKPVLEWNPSLAPEYYTVAAPKLSDLDKLNVVAATTNQIVLTGTGFYGQTWEVSFSDALNFTVTASGPGILMGEAVQSYTLPAVLVEGSNTYTVFFNVTFPFSRVLLSFNIVRDPIYDGNGIWVGNETFANGDKFVIDAPFITSVYTVTPTVGSGVKGKITNVNSLDTYQTIDGVTIKENDRILVKNQGTSAENGIYIVKPGAFVRAADFSGITEVINAIVFDKNRELTYISSLPNWTWSVTSSTVSNTNNWQESNFWYHRDELVNLGVNDSKIIQATRPIIQFNANLVINTRFDSQGLPTNIGGTEYTQIKTEFNQAPVFDLYRYDGTHSRKVSTIFFYSEDPTAEIDPALQRRVANASNISADFLFAHGLLENNTLLFYKTKDDILHTIWHPGYSSTTVIDQEFAGTGDGTLSVSINDPYLAQQIWVLEAVSPTVFELSGSKLKTIPTPINQIIVNTPYTSDLFNITITPGITPFSVGDTFTFRTGNFETTRYVYRDSDEAVYDLYGSTALDVNEIGAWQIPRMFYTNVAADNGEQIPEGTLYSHFRGILTNQLVTTPEDRAFGGSIKLWSEQQNLLAALLMQRDLTPISVIDLAQKQYETAVNAIVNLYFDNLLQYMSDVEVLISPADTNEFLDFLLTIRAKDQDVRTVLYDSTSALIGFPATLPMLGVTPLNSPAVVFDNELGLTLLQAHDGHLTPLYTFDQTFRDKLLSPATLVRRSDGTFTAAVGSFTNVPPVQPFKGELWFYASANELKSFNVLSDKSVAPIAQAIGDFWYNRNSNVLYVWDGALWQVEPNILLAWQLLDPAKVLNDLLLNIEVRLYNGINSQHRTYFTEADVDTAISGILSQQLQRELAIWSATNGYDPTAPDYVSTDAFTWNYSSLAIAQFAPVNSSAVPARWYNALHAHQLSVPGVIETSRPNLEPWKLLGNVVKPMGWDAAYAAATTPTMVDDPLGGYTFDSARVVVYSTTPLATPLSGLPTIDGVTLLNGQIVLLVSELATANNGLWVVSSGPWSRAVVPLVQNLVVQISDGLTLIGTEWVLTANVPVVNIDPVIFDQVRQWKQIMWSDIQTARPTLKLSVDVNRDILLPPYVSPIFAYSVNALTTTMPPTPADSYQFGEGSPVETVWTKSIDYRYALAKSLFKYDPLAFLGYCWGFEWVEVDGILYDGFDIAVPGHPYFRLQGDAALQITRTLPFTISLVTGPAQITLLITHDGYTSTRKQSFSVKDTNGVLIGYVAEGITSSVSGAGYTLSNIRIEDEGKPFRVGDSFTLTANFDGSGMSVVFNPNPYAVFLGFGQTFTHALRENSIDTNQGYSIQAYRGWDINLGYRAGGLVSTDDLRVFNDTDSLPDSSYSLRFKKSPYAKDLWVQGLRVQVVELGEFEELPTGGFKPTNDASDWVFRIDGYNSRYLEIEYTNLNPLGNTVTFNALQGAHTTLPWYQPTDILGTPITTQLPITITGLQNVVTFLFGYSEFLKSQGWKFNDDGIQNIDAETGRVRNWQLEIEKLIDRVYGGILLGQGHVINPFMDRIWLEQDTGLLSTFFDTSLFDITGHPGLFDTLGAKINTENTIILRSRGKSQISANVPMFSVHAQIDEYEHLFVFNNLSSPSTNEGLIYDPFSGARIATIKLNGRKQAANTLRPEFGGHYLVGDEVKRNLQSSTDKIAAYYDTDHVFEDELSTRHALALLGFSPKQYMADLDLTDRTQFNFWRGLVQMKGTNASIDAFLNNDRFQDAKLDEYWAYKVAEYGDSRSKIFPELKLSVDDTLQQFTKLQFDSNTLQDQGFASISAGDEDRWFSIDDLDGETSFEAQVVGTYNNTFTVFDVYPLQITLPFNADRLDFNPSSDYEQLNSITFLINVPCSLSVTGYGPSTPKFNPIKLFNYVDSELIEEIPQWHPLINQHTPTALEGINIISKIDPAKYNVSTQVIGNSNYDPLHTWGAKELGRVWWDTTNLDYVPYSDSIIFPTINKINERLSRWGALADYATVDVIEWVESSVEPSLYDAQAIIDAGDADLDASTKADGTVYGAKTYTRDRQWYIRPIAWSRAGVPTVAAHTGGLIGSRGSFNADYNATLILTHAGLACLDVGTFAASGIEVSMRIGAFQDTPSYLRAMSENTITGFTKFIGFPDLTTAFSTLSYSYGGLDADLSVTVSSYTSTVGQLLFTALPNVVTQLIDVDGVSTNIFDISSYIKITDQDNNEDIILIRTDRITGTEAVPEVPAVPSTAGYQTVFFGPVKTNTDNTGLNVGTYTASININGTAYAISITVTSTMIFGELISLINSQLPNAPVELIDGNLVITSPTFGITSSVIITDVDLFSSLNDFAYISASVLGTNTIPAIPAIPAGYAAEFNISVGDQFSFVSNVTGLTLTLISQTTDTLPIDSIANFIEQALSANISLFDAAEIETIVSPSSDIADPSSLSNDFTSIANANIDPEGGGIGWRAWSVPTQAQLNADSKYPNSEWYPMLGDFIAATATIDIIKDATINNNIVLNNGTSIQRYNTTWADWVELTSTIIEFYRNISIQGLSYAVTTDNAVRIKTVAITNGSVSLPVPTDTTIDRISVYVNGVAQLTGTYSLVNNTVNILSVTTGAYITIIIRAYTPSAEELAFDPDTADNVLVQTQYKIDYQYVSIPIRNSDGTISTTKYYFWVKNRSSAARKKKLSVKAMAQLLISGPSNYLTFQNISDTISPYYDAITISGLSYVVTKDDTFKLRFTRNFTLRDDPQQLDLKDTHVEWTLIRPGQRTKIPEDLWNKMVNTACGSDPAGNVLPSPKRASYDERNFTNTRFGFGADQILAPTDLVVSTLLFTVLNTSLIDDSGVVPIPDYISFLDFNQSDTFFNTAANTRNTLTRIWNEAKVSQINELFFAVLNDICAANYELSDLFKTSRLSAYSIKVVRSAPIVPTYE